MTDISPLVNELLKSHDAGIVRRRPYSLQTLNGFLKEAYTIVRHVLTAMDSTISHSA